VVIQILLKYCHYSRQDKQEGRQERSIYKVDHNFLTYTVIILTNVINIPQNKYFQMLFNMRLNSLFYTRKLRMLVTVGLAIAISLTIMSVNAISVIAQFPSIPSFPSEDEDANQQPPTTDDPSIANTSNIQPPTISITSLEDGQEIPVGELIIQGTSSDSEESNCQVYADVNDVAPLQNATAAGPSGSDDDFSQWTFVYTEDYQLITEGANELTAKISCYNGNNPTPVSEWHSVNVTGVTTGAPVATNEPTTNEPTTNEPTTNEPTTNEPTTNEGTTSIDEAAPNEDETDGEESEGLVPPFG
jgi:hypothetical protein